MEVDLWDLEAIDLLGPGFIEFRTDRTGHFRFIAVEGWMDYAHGKCDGRPSAEFTWGGSDEGDAADAHSEIGEPVSVWTLRLKLRERQPGQADWDTWVLSDANEQSPQADQPMSTAITSKPHQALRCNRCIAPPR